MTLQTIASLVQNAKCNVRLAIQDVGVSEYSQGKRTRVIGQDEEKNVIALIGFQDVFDICKKIEIGNTYIFNDVMCSVFQEKLQLKISGSSTVHTSAVEIPLVTHTVTEMKQKSNEFVNTTLVVLSIGDLTPTKNGSHTRRVTFSDTCDSINAILFNDSAHQSLQEGDVLHVRGKMGQQQTLLVFSNVTKTVNTSFDEWWRNEERASKRQKTIYTLLGDITEDMIGMRIEVAAIVLSHSLAKTTTQNGTSKRMIVVGDPSHKSIEVNIFGDRADDEYNRGQYVCFSATVSDWNRFSLNTNANEMRQDTFSVQMYTDMPDWWMQLGKDATFESLSVSDVHFQTIGAVVREKPTRASVKGTVKDGIVKDETASLPLLIHKSYYNGTLEEFENERVAIRNAWFKDGSLILFKSSTRVVSKDSQTTLMGFVGVLDKVE
jgi:hypothetical protein